MKLETRIAKLEADGAPRLSHVVNFEPGETVEAALARFAASKDGKARNIVVLPTVAASTAEWLATN